MSVSISLKVLFGLPISNESLMEQYKVSGDSQFLSRLYENCSVDLYHFLLTQSDPELAEDICQKAWLKVIEKKHLFQSKSSFKPWLFTLSRNLLIDEYRRLNRWQWIEQQDIAAAADPLLSELELDYNQALMKLPFLQREAYVLQAEGFGLQDIANITDCKIETVKTRIRYAKTKLKQLLESRL